VAALGRRSVGNSLSNYCTWGGRTATAATACGLHGLIKEEVLALEKVRPEAACKTSCLEGMIDRPNFARKSIPNKGVATAASKNSKLKVWSEKQTEKWQKPQAGMVLQLAPTRC